MLFDVQAALSEIMMDHPCDNRDNRDKPTRQGPFVANVADVATTKEGNRKLPEAVVSRPVRQTAPSEPHRPDLRSRPEDDSLFQHGRSVAGKPLTWTGKVVSLDEWKRLTQWERHGSTGKAWNGLTRQWEPMGGGAA